MEKLKKWAEENNLQLTVDGRLVKVEGVEEKFVLHDYDFGHGILFDSALDIYLDQTALYYLFSEESVKYLLFDFGGKFYYSEIEKDSLDFELKPFRNIGVCSANSDYVHLGVHGGYELLNGSGLYKDWVEKAKFYGHKSLGICEFNTLAASLAFQTECKNQEIKSILGETVNIKLGDYECHIKLYVKNKVGWQNLLKIHKNINVDGDGTGIHINDLISFTEGLICILPQEYDFENEFTKTILGSFEDIFYQIDTTIYRSNKKDSDSLKALRNYVRHHYDKVPPILLSDSYYIEKDYGHVKKMLNKIGDVKFQNESRNQYFKTLDECYEIIGKFFTGENETIWDAAVQNTYYVESICDFEIDTSKFRLPKYELTEEESKLFSNSEELFHELMEEGLERKVAPELHQQYRERLEEEIRVIKQGGFIDYFLILWDIMQWCKREGVLRGIGRGSAAGALISYLLDITEADPIKYDLLFERFLNEARLSQGLPDIDCDFPGLKRDDVKRYMEQRYGIDYVASIGTYSTMKLKMATKDIGRAYGLEFSKMNHITTLLEDDKMSGKGKSFKDIFQTCLDKTELKDFIRNNPDVINTIFAVLNQPRSSSIHASAVIIVPKEDENGEPMTIYDWMPVRKVDGVLISEWEAVYVEKAGFLKEDILGIAQLDKFESILKLIKEHYGKEIDIYDEKQIPLDDSKVYDVFALGLNEDVFQFGSPSQKTYSKEVLPTNIEHLNAMNALYRPGPMDVNAHIDYYKIKNTDNEPHYDWGTEEVLKSTYGLIVYQEQTMKIAQVLADFNLTEADGLRRALTKKGKGSEAQNFKDKFIERCVDKGCPEKEAHDIWEKLEAFTKYGFNRSHSLSYAITGYMCQWFKVNYPLEFWITSLHFSKEEAIFQKLSEINKLDQGVNVLPPDINMAREGFYADVDTKNIYWSLSKIKYVGESAVEVIINERNSRGKFYDFEEFISRVPKAKINKRVVYHLILSGAFDDIAGIDKDNIKDRVNLIKLYCKLHKKDVEDEFLSDFAKRMNVFWTLKQKESCGFGDIDYKQLLKKCKFGWKNVIESDYIDEVDFFTARDGDNAIVGGIVKYINKRNKKDGDPFVEIKLQCNNAELIVTLWTDAYVKYFKENNKDERDKRKLVGELKDKIIFVSGAIYRNNWRKVNTLKSFEKTQILLLDGDD